MSTANPQYTKRELVNQILDSNSKILVTTNDLLDIAKAAAAETGLERIITLEDGDGSEQNGITRWSEVVRDSGEAFVNNSDKLNPVDHCAILPYSSGTTGKPKGVMLTHHNIISNLIQSGNYVQEIPRNIVLGLLPFYHIYGMAIVLFGNLQYCKTIVIMPKFEPTTFLQAVQDYKVNNYFVILSLFLCLRICCTSNFCALIWKTSKSTEFILNCLLSVFGRLIMQIWSLR